MTETADIVERLESALSHFVATEADGMTSYTSEMLMEAAAEITRLRGLLRQAHCVIAHGSASGLAWEYTLDNIDDALNRPRFTECEKMLAKKLAGSSE